MSNKQKWFLQATIGLLLIGTGLSMCIDAGFEKFQGNPWILYGTISLAIFNAGLCVLIDAPNRK